MDLYNLDFSGMGVSKYKNDSYLISEYKNAVIGNSDSADICLIDDEYSRVVRIKDTMWLDPANTSVNANGITCEFVHMQFRFKEPVEFGNMAKLLFDPIDGTLEFSFWIITKHCSFYVTDCIMSGNDITGVLVRGIAENKNPIGSGGGISGFDNTSALIVVTPRRTSLSNTFSRANNVRLLNISSNTEYATYGKFNTIYNTKTAISVVFPDMKIASCVNDWFAGTRVMNKAFNIFFDINANPTRRKTGDYGDPHVLSVSYKTAGLIDPAVLINVSNKSIKRQGNIVVLNPSGTIINNF